MTLTQNLNRPDLPRIIDRMALYANKRLKGVDPKKLQSIQGIDFVSDVLEKVANGKRDWEKVDCSFEAFLFGCLKSDLSNFFRKAKVLAIEDFLDETFEEKILNTEETKKEAIHALRECGANETEINVFECWAAGIIKSQEVADNLEIDVNLVYSTTKKLIKRLEKIQPRFITL